MGELSRLRWHCRRGMRELDLLLGHFLEHRYGDLEADQQEHFRRLLEYPDDRLYDWFYQGERPDDECLSALVEQIRAAFFTSD